MKEAWNELWEKLHHQGDVGEASHCSPESGPNFWSAESDWKTYPWSLSLKARGKGKNPEIPEWLNEEKFSAIQDLAKSG